MKNILVTGGLGFIGSHTVVSLMEAGFNPVILDNLKNSRVSVLDGIEKITGKRAVFFKGDINDPQVFSSIFSEYSIAAVIHFAAYKAVGESVEKPLLYYRNNVGGMLTLLEAMEAHNIKTMVFSSSCTVYGEADEMPITEEAPVKASTSPYAATKQMCENILSYLNWCNTLSLRYFNPVGAHASGAIGELPLGTPNNLVPYLTQAMAGLRPPLTVHGSDYPTRDGSCIRDYIHVMDLADAHVCALNCLLNEKSQKPFDVINIGTGTGSTVLEVIKAFASANGLHVPYQIGPRRPGDVVQYLADTKKAEIVLGFKTKFTLTDMMRDAWNWQKNAPST